ncbi:MAG: carbamoyltransferase [Alphaproteobacteria bacterium]
MIIVGIHNTGTTSSAAIVVDGSLEFGCAEERLDRRKYSKYFPERAIDACLDWTGATLADVDAFAIGWNPGINIAGRYRAGFSEWPAYPGARLYTSANRLLPRLESGELTATDQIFAAEPGQGADTRFVHVTHHLAHCANAFYLSGFDDAALFSCDGYGERTTTVWGRGQGGDITTLRQSAFPHSIGSFYAAVTQFLGFRPDLDEWKVMGAAAYGDPARYQAALSGLLNYDEDGRFELDLRYFAHFDFDSRSLFAPRITELLGPPRPASAPMEPRHFDIAAALQAVVETYLFTAVRWLARATGCRRACLSGGVMMNSLFNGRLAQTDIFDDVFIPFAPDDSGNSIGAALWLAHREEPPGRCRVQRSPYLGRDYADDAIRAVLDRFKLRYRVLGDVPGEVADLLAAGKVVAWFQGRMEFGQRALGARSILADPRDPHMKDRINAAVKFREGFRPFAPAVPAESLGEWFAVDRPLAVPYMEKVLPIRADRRHLIPAVVHADGTGRLQTVERSMNPLFHDLLTAFGQRTGVPILLNTSFNVAEEPIVESPADAIRTFYASGIDALVCGRYSLIKDGVATGTPESRPDRGP